MGLEPAVDCCCFPLLTGFVLGFMSRSPNILESKSSAAVAAGTGATGILESAWEDDILGVVFELLAMIGVGLSPNRSPKGSEAAVPEETALKFSAEELVFIIGGLGFKKSAGVPLPPEMSSKQSILLLLLVTCLDVGNEKHYNL